MVEAHRQHNRGPGPRPGVKALDNGTADNGTGNNGTADNGTADNGTADNGTADNGTADNGAADNGTADDGTADNGTANNGTADNAADDGTTPPRRQRRHHPPPCRRRRHRPREAIPVIISPLGTLASTRLVTRPTPQAMWATATRGGYKKGTHQRWRPCGRGWRRWLATSSPAGLILKL